MRSAFTYLRAALPCGLALLALGCPAGALAASGTGTGTGTGENTPLNLTSTTTHHASSGGPSIVRTLLALVIVIGLIYAIARIMKAVKRGGRSTQAKGDGLEHLATLPLSSGRSVALVRSGSDVVLVGISESGVTPIKVYTEAEAITNGILVPDSMGSAIVPYEPSEGVLGSLRRLTVRV